MERSENRLVIAADWPEGGVFEDLFDACLLNYFNFSSFCSTEDIFYLYFDRWMEWFPVLLSNCVVIQDDRQD